MSAELPEPEFTEPAIVDWAMLQPHAKRGALFLLDASLDIAEVGGAIAGDDSARIKALLDGGLMRRPEEAEIDGDGEARFRFLIVQPFVIAQGPLAS